jgi:hypothetical protein
MQRHASNRCAANLCAIVVCHLILVLAGMIGLPPVAAQQMAHDLRVRTPGGLSRLDEVIRDARANETLQTYRQLREAHGGTPAGELDLARWCRKQGLKEEERLHWNILQTMQPGHPEAVKRLQLRQYRGMLLPNEAIDKLRSAEKKAQQAEKNWLPKLRSMREAIEHGDSDQRAAAIGQLRDLRDPLAIGALQKVFGVEDAAIQTHIIEAVSQMPGDEASELLVRTALESSDEYVREQAAKALRSGADHTYVSKLIGRLAAPIDLKSYVSVTPGGTTYEPYASYAYTGRLGVGLFNKVRLRSEYTSRDVAFWGPEVRPFSGSMVTGERPDRLRYEYVLTRESPDPEQPYEYVGYVEADREADRPGHGPDSLERFVAKLKGDIRDANDATAELNRRIDAALRLTQADAPAQPQWIATDRPEIKPQIWWTWWRARDIQQNYLAQGMEVWTLFGLAPIEDVLVGERVLTKDLDSGELAFGLVVGRDRQTMSNMRILEVDDRTIVVTPRQQFHVPGPGWRPADGLSIGETLTTLAGTCTIKSIESSNREDITYSLMLQDGSNYFVDGQGVLVHDASRLATPKKGP